jgi:hypothetical protein
VVFLTLRSYFKGKKMMKKYALMFVLLSILSFPSCTDSINNGLVAYYPFDGDANDYSDNSNHGTINGAVLIADRFGRENNAFSFDGEKATIEANVKNMPAIDSPQSFSWWFRIHTEPTYINDLGADNMIALVDSGKGIGIQFGFRAPGYQTLGFDAWNWGGGTLLEAEQPEVNKWHHCVYIYDGLIHRLYVDGKEVSKSEANTQQDIPNLLMFGNYPSGNQYFAGDMDDIRIYNRVLNKDEINVLLNEGN